MAHHVHRAARLGSSVLIIADWYDGRGVVILKAAEITEGPCCIGHVVKSWCSRLASMSGFEMTRDAGGNDEKQVRKHEISLGLSDLEFALINLSYGFHRWVENCMAASGIRGLSATDILVLHAVNHRARGRRLAEICMVLNIDDTHLVSYSLKKLVAAGFACVKRQGRESLYESTPTGDAACIGYRKVREEFLVTNVQWFSHGRPSTEISDMTLFLRTLTAMYDQSGRSATAAAAPPSPPVRTKR